MEPDALAREAAFPSYRSGEEAADRCIHLLGLALGSGAALALLRLAARQPEGRVFLATAVYAVGLITMLLCSALYNMAPPSRLKAWLRRLDHAAIFLMIAGTYTPFLLGRMGGAWGWGMLAFVWLAAGAGAALALAAGRRHDALKLAAYLLLGWGILAVRQPLSEAVAGPALLLLLIGGILYSLGVVFHLWERLGYHNAIWHGFVLAAAGCHYGAVLLGVVLPAGRA